MLRVSIAFTQFGLYFTLLLLLDKGTCYVLGAAQWPGFESPVPFVLIALALTFRSMLALEWVREASSSGDQSGRGSRLM